MSEMRKTKFGGSKNREELLENNMRLIDYLRSFKDLD